MLEITEEQLTEWLALCDASSRAPWEGQWVDTAAGPYRIFAPEVGRCVGEIFGYSAQTESDGEFAVAARTAMPALIAALREARAKHDRLLGGFGDLQELLNALAVEQDKVKRLREFAAAIANQYLPVRGNTRAAVISRAARVLKETE